MTMLNIVDVKSFGAKGDGTTDDTTAFQNALNTTMMVFVPVGNFIISAPLVFKAAGQQMIGAGIGNPGTPGSGSTITCKAGFSGAVAIDFNQFQPGPILKGLRITTAFPGVPNTGVYARNAARLKIQDCRINLFGIGLDMSGNAGGSNINNLEMWNTSVSLFIDGSLDGNMISGLRVWPFDDPNGTTFTASMSGTTMTVTAATINAIGVGQTVVGSGVTPCTITALGTGTGGAGTYTISVSQTVSSRAMGCSGVASFTSHTAMITGRCDDLLITNSELACFNQINSVQGAGICANFTGTISGTNLSISGLTGQIQIGQTVVGSGVAANTIITAGGGSSFTVSVSQFVGPVSMTGGFPGFTQGNITNTAFDTWNSLVMSAGSISVSNSTFGGGNAAGFAVVGNILQSGGILNVSNCLFQNAFSTIVSVTTGAQSIQVTGCRFDFAGNTSPGVQINGAGISATISDNVFARSSGVGGNYMITKTAGRLTAIGNRCPVDGTGNFITCVTADNSDRVVYNAPGNWSLLFPGSPGSALYTPN